MGKPSAIESIMGERGRLRTTHEMLKTALETEPRDHAFVPFYIAVGNYMEASMGRLHSQDVNMLERLASKIDMQDPDNEEVIAEVYRRLEGNQAHLKSFLECRDALKTQGDDAQPAFEETSLAYIDYIHNRMGHHAPSTDLARQVFTEEDWVEMADLDEAYFQRETELFKAVFDNRPEGVSPGKSAEDYVSEYRRDRG